MTLIELYTSILKFSGLEADDEGYISTSLDDRKDPTLIEGARLVLPSPNHLKGYNPKEKIIFHPLTENILRGESEVIKKLKHTINIKLNFSIGIVAQSLLNLVASPDQHKLLSPQQADLLTSITEADEKSVVNFINIMVKGVKAHADRLFVNIYLKQGGKYHGKKHARVGIVGFPFYQNLLDDKVEGIRVKDKATYKELFEFIFPDIDEAEAYNFASNSQVAPNLESLLRTAAKIASRINDIIDTYKDFIDDADKLTFEANWLEDFSNLEDWLPEVRKIPLHHGNEGSVSAIEESEPVQMPVAMQAQALQQPQMPQYPQAPQYPQQPQQMQYQQPQQPEIKQGKRGIDFKSMKQALPGLAYNPNPMMPAIMQQQMLQQQQAMAQRRPSWDQPQMQQPMGVPPGYIMTPQGMMPIQQAQQMGYQPAPSWAQQPMGQQPMMSQPMMQQPMMQQPMGYPMQPMGYPQQGWNR